MLIQMRTSKIELLNYKHKIKQSNIKFCNCENVKNVQHVLLQCSKWTNFKQKIYEKWFVNNLTKFLNTQTLIKIFTIFLSKIKLLYQFRNYKTKSLDSIFHENKKNRFFKQTIDEFSKITNLDSIFSKISKCEYVISQNVDWMFEKLLITKNHHIITIFDDANAKFFNAIINSFETWLNNLKMSFWIFIWYWNKNREIKITRRNESNVSKSSQCFMNAIFYDWVYRLNVAKWNIENIFK